MLKIKPRAANAFDLEILNWKDEVAYKLEFHSDENRLHILCRDKKFKVKESKASATIEEHELTETNNITIEG